jgi:hypothetical protein
MTRNIITAQCPVIDKTQSVTIASISKFEVNPESGVKLENAFKNKNNSLFLFVENESSSASTIIINKGNAYPNSILGDLEMNIPAESTTVLQIQDPSRFEMKDGSVEIDFGSGFVGNVYAVAKSVALNV